MSAEDAPILDAERLTNEGSSREDSGNNSEATDYKDLAVRAELLARTSEIAREAAFGLRDSGWKEDWIVLLAAVSMLTAEMACAGDPAPKFTAEVLRGKAASLEGLTDAQWWSDDGETGRKKFANAWRGLEENFWRICENLCSRAAKAGVAGKVYLVSTKVGATKGYGLSVEHIEVPERGDAHAAELVAQMRTQAAEIDYLEEIEVHPIPWIKRPLRLSLLGWRVALIIAPIVIALVIAGFLGWLLLMIWMSDLPLRTILQWTLLGVVMAGVVGSISRPFFLLINNRVLRAPTFLELTLPLGHILVLRREGEDRVLRMLRYTGTCPVCGGDVTIENGRRIHRGRLVGQCGRNPVEHVFSFDFITGKGSRL
ncbi:hypothetical protein AZOA_39580 [Azoarcus sp. Aa7]|nr:hypothetical protein [Azoarcus sp. Aa7]